MTGHARQGGQTPAQSKPVAAAATEIAPRAVPTNGPVKRMKPARPPSRAVVMRLAAEVDALAAQLEDSRARILDLEARVDVDPLTETLNRRGFERELKRSLAYVKRYGAGAALIYLDLDGFKPVNDRHGHGAGDAMLKAVAATLVRNVRASDVVARFGGDEFVLLLWNVSGPAAAAKARRAGSGRLRHAGAMGPFDARCRRVRRRGASWRARHRRRRAGARRYGDVCAQKRAQGNCPGAPGAGAAHAIISGVSSSSMKVMRSRK